MYVHKLICGLIPSCEHFIAFLLIWNVISKIRDGNNYSFCSLNVRDFVSMCNIMIMSKNSGGRQSLSLICTRISITLVLKTDSIE